MYIVIALCIVIALAYFFLFNKTEKFQEGYCYEARDANDCYTCEDIKKAYDDLGWVYDPSTFQQCNVMSSN